MMTERIKDYLANNKAAKIIAERLDQTGTGIRPIVDHVTVRTLNVEESAKEFLNLGFVYDAKLGVLEYEDWWAKVYRKNGYPAVFIDQPFEGKRGEKNVIHEWVSTFGSKTFHHIAIQVGDVEVAAAQFKKLGIELAGEIVGERGSDLRQVFTKPDMKNGKPFTVLEIAERHRGYEGFLPPQANKLMESTRLKKGAY
ncbi:MAG: hypothetical protein HYS56_05685 [Candidatus Omnitrophica bacterium]|nr:hypothetical protein [Candidatus Omnitrophota bacterium]